MAGTHNESAQVSGSDEFENPPAGPIGLHRGQRGWWARFWPYLVTLLVAVALALATWLWISGTARDWFQGTQPEQTTTTTITEDDATKDGDSAAAEGDSAATDESDTPSDATDDTADDAATTQETAPTVNHDVAVRVVNAIATQPRPAGFASTKAKVLTDSGYTNVTPTNPTGSVPASNVVWYKDEANKSTAEDIAAKLGISTVEQVSANATDVSVVFITE